MSTDDLELTILMPCLNEAETLVGCVEQALGFLAGQGIAGEVLVADNGSTDGSPALARRAGARVVEVADKGYGAALLGGLAVARGRLVIMGDADGSYDFAHLQPFVAALREGAQLVMGNRFHGGIMPGAMPFLHRYLGNPCLTALGRLLFRHRVCGDFHCGLRGFQRQAMLDLDLRTTGMEFASEMVIKSTLHELRIVEVPTTLAPDGRTRPPHLRTWHDGWRHLRFMLLYSPTWVFLLPGLSLMLAGAAGGLALLIEGRRIGGVGLDIHTLLYATTAMIVGYQAVLFAAFSRVFALNTGLVPSRASAAAPSRFVSLEKGLLAGMAMLAGGLVLTGFALWQWRQAEFGALQPQRTMRLAIPAATLLALGCQTIFASFFLSILALPKR